jgi:hypothetical protein
MNTRLFSKTPGVLAVALVYGMTIPAAVAAGEPGLPIYSTNGAISIWTSPYLNGTAGQNPPPPITSDQIRQAVPAEMPKMSIGAKTGSRAGQFGDARVQVIPATLPDSRARPLLPGLGNANEAVDAQGDASPLPDLTAAAQADTACKEPNPGWQNLDCYLHPWTESPGNLQKQFRSAYPWIAIGRLFFHEPTQGPADFYHHCTAQVIAGPPNNLIVTAAHCVVNQGNGVPNKDWIFVPASFAGSQPYGQFPYKAAYTLPQWVETQGANRYDVALLSLQEDKRKKPVSYYTGTLGLLVNGAYDQNLNILGYSIAQAPEGAWSTANNASSFRNQNQDLCEGNSLPNEDVLLVGSSLSYGASGGAWINAFYPFESGALHANLVTSVVSGGLLCSQGGLIYPVPGILAGPRFSDNNIGILCANLPGGCATPRPLATLTVTVAGDGSVASSPTGMQCSGDSKTGDKTCTAQFPVGGQPARGTGPGRQAVHALGRWLPGQEARLRG